jgi:8-oxo-dGTP pyrophosphatase MutT (NUDIX family)
MPVPAPRALELGAALERVLRGRRPAELDLPGRRAAVLLVLHDVDDRAHLLLTKRTESMPSHPGQVSLPGGVAEAADGSLRDTALRETEEEVGIPADALRVLGELDDVSTMVSGFIIRPFVAVAGRPLRPAPSDAEVARVLQVPVAELLRADALLPAEPAPLALRYPLAGEDVWGATARILRIFCAVLRDALSPAGQAQTAEGAGPGR